MREERYDKVMVIWSDIWILASASNKCLSAFRRLNGREIERQCGFLPLFKETVPQVKENLILEANFLLGYSSAHNNWTEI